MKDAKHQRKYDNKRIEVQMFIIYLVGQIRTEKKKKKLHGAHRFGLPVLLMKWFVVHTINK